MNNEWLKKELNAINYKDDTDVVALRYLLLQALAQFASEYKKVPHTRDAFKLLQQYRKLETAHADLKHKSRNNCAKVSDFLQAKGVALEHIAYVNSFRTMDKAA